MKNRNFCKKEPSKVIRSVITVAGSLTLLLTLLLVSCIPQDFQGTVDVNSPSPTPQPAGHLGYGPVTGTVIDSITGYPIPGAVVHCAHVTFFPQSLCSGQVTTAEDGTFRFENIFFHDTDTITLEVEANGYLTREVSSPFFTQAGWIATINLDPIPSDSYSFQRMDDSQGFPANAQVFDLWISPQGKLWIATDAGLYIGFPEQGEGFTQFYEGILNQIIGLQEVPYTIWALGLDGNTIHAYDGETWTVYGADEGWEPLSHPITSEAPAVSPDGVVWLATGQDDLRRFDPRSGTWSSLCASGLGFSPADPDYQGHYLTDTVVDQDGNLWVSDCIGMGESYTGQGVRYLSNGEWNPITATAGLCIFDLNLDPDGRMWVGGSDMLLVYDPVSDTWNSIPLPPWDRRQYILEISFDPAGKIAVTALQCGGASCDTVAFFYRQDDVWLPILDTESYYWPAPGLVLDSNFSVWTCWQGEVLHQVGTSLVRVGRLQVSSCQVRVDSNGIVWVAAGEGEDAGLWQVHK